MQLNLHGIRVGIMNECKTVNEVCDIASITQSMTNKHTVEEHSMNLGNGERTLRCIEINL